jgi:hypothetical protein
LDAARRQRLRDGLVTGSTLPPEKGAAVVDYTFYPCRADGSSMAFDAAEFSRDEDARAFAQRVLERHDSAVEVEIWAGERRLGRISRRGAD